MRTMLLAAALAVAAPTFAGSMPLAPAIVPGGELFTPVQDCGPPVRRIETDMNTGQQMEVWVRRPCPRYRSGYDERPAPRYYEEAPVYRPAPRYYEEERVYRPRRPPPPGWERDPYTGRDTRILR